MKKLTGNIAFITMAAAFGVSMTNAATINPKQSHHVSKAVATHHISSSQQHKITKTLTPQQIQSNQIVNTQLNVDDFKALDIGGFDEVEVIGKQQSYQVTVRAGADTLAHLLQINENAQRLSLHVRSKKIQRDVLEAPQAVHKKRHQATVTVRVPNLNDLQVQSSGKVTVTHMDDEQLKVDKKGSGAMKISGQSIQLRRLHNQGKGPVTIQQIDTPKLQLNLTKQGKVTFNQGHIENLIIQGKGNVTFNSLRTDHLDIHDDSAGTVQLRGKMALQHLNFHGSGDLNAYWIDTEHLKINGRGSGKVSLAGVANVLDANLSDQMQLDTRYMRVNDVFVRTNRDATAHVWPNDNLFAFAGEHSNIYYYHNPPFLSQQMARAGSILAMNDIQDALLNFEPSMQFMTKKEYHY